MRLLQYNSAGQLGLTKDLVGDDIPEYAILSHTWGADTDEVTFRDLIDGTGQSKAGYGKIRFCAQQAVDDGLQYSWVDTCCIDKSSSTELQEAMNSMFRWYQNAVKCYVYLSDVWARKRKESDRFSECTWESAFRGSRWFTRGWTFQELLASDSVEFFSREGKQLGNKRALERQIHETTGIPITALRGTPLSQFGVDDRFLWAENRYTTREEDKAYSLFGIFDIQIPLLYGEGRDKALKRLREEIDKPLQGLDILPFATDAPFNSINLQDELTCLPNTRVDLLQEIYNWADRQDEWCIFWLNGLAGTGKSTIARTVARRYFEERLGASFFFSRGGGDVSHAGKFFTSIAVQLANNIPSLRQYIYNAISKHKDIANQSLRDQWYQLILRPLSRLDSGSFLSSYVLVIDALDECDKEEHIRIILELLAEVRMLKTVRLRVFLTSRPEIPIRHGFYQIPDTEHQDFVLHNISSSIVNHDISIFLRYSLDFIAGERFLGAGWPGEQIVKRLVCSASGLFIWAATACRFIREGKRFAAKRLDMILESSSTTINAPEEHLNGIYLTVLRHSISPDYTPEEAKELGFTVKTLLGSIVTLFSPLSTQSLSKLLNISPKEVDQTLNDFHAILDIPKDVSQPLRLHHPSFRDFLLNKKRCSDSNFLVNEKQAHRMLANCCIRLMSMFLKQDICEQGAPGALVADIQNSQIEQCLPLEVRYACLYWIQHFQKSDAQLYDNNYVYQFLQKHFLHWFEALSWIRKSSEGILAILSLESQVQADKLPNLYTFLHDAKRFALYNRSIIEKAPLQLYCSALVFAPENSIIRRQFGKNISPLVEMKSQVQANWGAALQSFEGHLLAVKSVAFSPNGKQIVSGSDDETVRLWDVVTGTALQMLKGHEDVVTSVTFSPDSKQIVSGSYDQTVRLWDVATGVTLQSFEGHLHAVTSVAFSPNGKQIVSGSNDETVRLWDVLTGATLQTLEGHAEEVTSVAFSPDGKQIVSGSYDQTVRLWDVATGAVLQSFEGHLYAVTSVAFSPDGKQIVSGSKDKTVQVWDVVTGAALQTLEGHSDGVTSVTFSPDGKQIVSGSYDQTVRLWDIVTGAALQTFKGHSYWVWSVAFSPDSKRITSGSHDKIVQVWDVVTSAALQTLEGHSDEIMSVVFSLDGKQIISGSNDKTVRLWDVVTGATLQTLEGHEDKVWSVGFSPDGKQIVSGSQDRTVRVWDVVTGAAVQTLKGFLSWVTFVAFSPDGKQIISGSHAVQLWDLVTGEALQTLDGHWDVVMSVTFSADGKRIVSGSKDKTVRLWDVVTGAALQTLEGHSDGVTSVTFSPDGKQIVSESYDQTVRVWDVVTGAALQILENHLYWVWSATFSPNGKAKQGLFVSNHWVVSGKENILWLPPEYRETCKAVWNKVIVLGHSSGRVSILELKDQSM
ncbi:WD40-repeat-containing domain protein [Bisporella sp. PMI_857]|nr:WD40-repeat-containing domain protein [Bisporella sp. PMI_857]